MAPARSKRANTNQYFDVGREGRKTGVTVAPQKQDQFGLESIDAVFSSPRRSPALKPSNGNDTLLSKDMEVSRGSAADPTEILTARRILKSTNSHLPPPSLKSPRKTNIGSSPRRHSSVGASARRSSMGPPIRSSAVSRKLNFQPDQPRPSIEGSPIRSHITRGQRQSYSADVYDLPPSSESPRPEQATHNINSIAEANEDEGYGDSQVDPATQLMEEQAMAGLEEQELPIHDDHIYQDGDDVYHEEPHNMYPSGPLEAPEEDEGQISSPIAQKKKRGRPRKSDNSVIEALETIEDSIEIAMEPEPKPKKKAGRPRKSDQEAATNAPNTARSRAKNPQTTTKRQAKGKGKGKAKVVSSVDEELLDPELMDVSAARNDSSLMPPPGNKSSRKRKPTESDYKVSENDDEDDEDVYEDPGVDSESASEEAGHVSESSVSEVGPSKKRKATKYSDREESSSSKRMRTSEERGSAPPTKSLFSQKSQRPGARELQIQREMTPADAAYTTTRRGRRVMKPVAAWKNEKVLRNYDGEVVEVLRTDEVLQKKNPRKRGAARGQKQPALLQVIEEDESLQEEDEEDPLEEWERERGIVEGEVEGYDPEIDTGTGEWITQELAKSQQGIITVENLGGDFKFGRILQESFFGAGIMELPVGGSKGRRNSRKMHMCFFVSEGKVSVTIANTTFAISKGGTWQIPRGNTYSIKNVGAKTATLFFAQGAEKIYEPPADEDEEEES
ncbi:hypothetical protein BT63DRAFT_422661 [Microthyrium microscopicum]|uniref:CENP-C homolog n=1 Tax=Microthyrium microscopicum TaxID=703497 RepID=A0A6A6UKV7_9PEZI|nr:hypothetical protein BT63DRAFT_422661 [Microthyrium microscopicum]